MSSGEIDAPGAFGFLTGVAWSVGLSSGDGVAFGAAEADSAGETEASGLGSGVGDDFFFFLPLEEAEGDGLGVGVSEGVGLAVGDRVGLPDFLRFGDAVGVGELSGFGEAEGDGDDLGVAVGVGELLDFFVAAPDRFFFGGGVGSKIFFSLSPRLGSERACGAEPAKSAAHTSATPTANDARPRRLTLPVPAGSPCSGEFQRRSFPAGNFR